MQSIHSLKVEDSYHWIDFYKSINNPELYKEENIKNLKSLLRLNKDFNDINNNYNSFIQGKDLAIYTNIDNASMVVKSAIREYLRLFHLQMMYEDISECLNSDIFTISEEIEKYKNIIVKKQEDSIVDLVLSDDEIPSMSGGVLAKLYMKNLYWGFFNEKTKQLMVKKIESWFSSEPREAFIFLNKIGSDEQSIFLESYKIIDSIWKQGSVLFEKTGKYAELMLKTYLRDPERVNSYDIRLCFRSKVCIFYMLESKFQKDGDFSYLKTELNNSSWLNNEEFIKDLENANQWEDLFLSKEKVTVVNPTLGFYYLMSKRYPKFIKLFSNKLARVKGDSHKESEYFASLLNKQMKCSANLKNISFWPEDLSSIFSNIINNDLLIMRENIFIKEDKGIVDFIIDGFVNATKSSELKFITNEDYDNVNNGKIVGNFFSSQFYKQIEEFIYLIPILLETEKDENKRSALNFIKFISDCYTESPGCILNSFENNSYTLVHCKSQHYNFLLDSIYSFLNSKLGTEGSINGLEAAFYNIESPYQESINEWKDLPILLENSILNYVSPINNIKVKVQKF